MRKSASIAVLLAALAPGLALADDCAGGFGGRFRPGAQQDALPGGPGGGGMPPYFADLDTNGDGQVSAEEAAVRRQSQFARADANGDGKLQPSEMTGWIGARGNEHEAATAARLVSQMDRDGDGALSLVEVQGANMPNRSGRFGRGNAEGGFDGGKVAAGPGGPGGAGGWRADRGNAQRGADTCGNVGSGRWQ